MGQQRLLLSLREMLKRGRDRRPLLLFEQPLIGSLDAIHLDQAVPVALLRVLRPPHRRNQVPRGRDGVRLKHARLDAIGGGKHLDEGLLDQILGRRFIPYPREDDPPQHRQQRSDIGCRFRVRPSSIELRGTHGWHITPGLSMATTLRPYASGRIVRTDQPEGISGSTAISMSKAAPAQRRASATGTTSAPRRPTRSRRQRRPYPREQPISLGQLADHLLGCVSSSSSSGSSLPAHLLGGKTLTEPGPTSRGHVIQRTFEAVGANEGRLTISPRSELEPTLVPCDSRLLF